MNPLARSVRARSAKPYQKQPKNHTARNLLVGWLRSAQIEVRLSEATGCDLVVKTSSGKDVQIKVGVTAHDPRPAVEHLFVLSKELTNRNRATALKAFHVITEAAGHGAPTPIGRGGQLEKKANYEDSFELVAMRHAEFRKVPNPTSEEFAQYAKVISKAVHRFMYINPAICRRHGLDEGDLTTYAQIWTANYLGLYRIEDPQNNDNERQLYAHLCQRFGNFVEVLLKKERSCIPDSETASVAQFGIPWGGKGRNSARLFQQERDLMEATAEEALEFELESEISGEGDDGLQIIDGLAMTEEGSGMSNADEEAREQKISDARRREWAQEQLAAELGKLDHEQMTYLLEEAAANGALCYDAQQEARKQLRIHRETCLDCARKLHVHDDAAAVQSGR